MEGKNNSMTLRLISIVQHTEAVAYQVDFWLGIGTMLQVDKYFLQLLLDTVGSILFFPYFFFSLHVS